VRAASTQAAHSCTACRQSGQTRFIEFNRDHASTQRGAARVHPADAARLNRAYNTERRRRRREIVADRQAYNSIRRWPVDRAAQRGTGSTLEQFTERELRLYRKKEQLRARLDGFRVRHQARLAPSCRSHARASTPTTARLDDTGKLLHSISTGLQEYIDGVTLRQLLRDFPEVRELGRSGRDTTVDNLTAFVEHALRVIRQPNLVEAENISHHCLISSV